VTDLPLTHLGDTLYRAGYTEPRLRQFWGPATSEALARNNAAPAIHRCTQCSGRRMTRPTAFDRGLASLALLFHFHCRSRCRRRSAPALGEDLSPPPPRRG
jgi:hypothetical protein